MSMTMSAFASEDLVTVTLNKDYFTTPKSFFANWEATSTGGVKGTNPEKDLEFYNTSLKVSASESFTFEADVSIPSGQEKGQWAALILNRLQDQLGGSNGGWYCLRWYADSGYVRFVNYFNKSVNNGKSFDYVDSTAIGFGQTHNLKIEYKSENKTFSIYWDGKIASSDKGPGVYEDSGFEGEWYIGIMSNKCDVIFENIKLTAPEKTFEAVTSETTVVEETTAPATTTEPTTTVAETTAAADTTAADTSASDTTAGGGSSKDGLSPGVIAGIVGGVVVIAGVAGYLIFRKKKNA